MTVRYPHVTVQLTGEDGNAYAILARVRQALLRAKVPQQEVKAFTEEATSGEYGKLLQTCMRWVNVQ